MEWYLVKHRDNFYVYLLLYWCTDCLLVCCTNQRQDVNHAGQQDAIIVSLSDRHLFSHCEGSIWTYEWHETAWCCCRWVRTFRGSLPLLLSGNHSITGSVCWRLQDGGAPQGTRLLPLLTCHAHARHVPRCLGCSSLPRPRIDVPLRRELLLWTCDAGILTKICFWYVPQTTCRAWQEIR
jgi:hypothetical protein